MPPTGPLIVSLPAPQRQLRSEGTLVTFRTDDRTTGQTHWREERTGGKQGDVMVERLVEDMDPSDPHWLTVYRDWSGFATVGEWQDAIRSIHDGLPDGGHLYIALTPGTSPYQQSHRPGSDLPDWEHCALCGGELTNDLERDTGVCDECADD